MSRSFLLTSEVYLRNVTQWQPDTQPCQKHLSVPLAVPQIFQKYRDKWGKIEECGWEDGWRWINGCDHMKKSGTTLMLGISQARREMQLTRTRRIWIFVNPFINQPLAHLDQIYALSGILVVRHGLLQLLLEVCGCKCACKYTFFVCMYTSLHLLNDP